mgnify:CR=1 FL=1
MEKLLCKEKLQPEYIHSDVTLKEEMALKPVEGLMTKIVRFSFEKKPFKCVAGGYAAYVDNRTFRYDDIDVFRTPLPTTSRRSHNYPDSTILKVIDKKPYQMIYTVYKDEDSIQSFMEKVLSSFDLQECCVAYGYEFLPVPKFVKCTRKIDYTKEKILSLSHKRMKKYNQRSKTVPTLKWLSLTIAKETFEKADLQDYINSVVLF